MRHAGIPTGVHVLLERDGRVLLMRRAGTGFFEGMYSLPGGHVEEGEALAATAAREMREELGIEPDAGSLSVVGVMHRRSDSNRIDFFVRVASWSGEPHIAEPDKCDALDWFSLHSLPGSLVPYVREALFAGQGPWIRESGWA